jgi:hypothetical protein
MVCDAGQSIVETRNGSNQATRQFVWGAMYVDELVQIGINSSYWTNNDCVGSGVPGTPYSIRRVPH